MVEHDDVVDETYFERPKRGHKVFDQELLQEPVTLLPVRKAVTFSPQDTVTVAMRAMQREHRGCVAITEDGTKGSKLVGIFTERDVLLRIVDRGKNPATLPLGEVMTADPEVLSNKSSVAHALNKMSIGGFRHIPVVDDAYNLALMVSVRDVVNFIVQAFPREILTIQPDSLPPPRAREGA